MKATLTILILFISLFCYSQAPLGHWKLDNNALDASGNNLNGTVVNGATFSTDRQDGTHALSVAGGTTNQFVDLGNPSSLPFGNASVSLAAWAKTTNTASGSRTIFAFGSPTAGAVLIGQQGGALTGGLHGSLTNGGAIWDNGVWHHVCMTYDGSTVRLYFDGVLKATETKSINITLLRAHIGKNVNNSSYWQGLIDDVRLYTRALTLSEVQALSSFSPQTPNAPTNLLATAISSSQINLSWTDNSTNETGFEVYRSTSETSAYSLITTTSAGATTFQNSTGLTYSTRYYYRVQAVNASGASSFAQADATTLDIAPAAPTNLVATANSSTAISLTWSDNANNETGFRIERSATQSGTYSEIGVTSSNATTYSDATLTGGSTYYYRIRAYNVIGNSAYSAVANATTPNAGVGPVGWWKLNNDVADASGNNMYGTLQGNPVFTTDAKEGSHGLSLNGSNQYVTLNNFATLPAGTSPRTMSVWAKTNNVASGYRFAVSYGKNSSNQAMFIGQYGSSLRVGGYGSANDLNVDNVWSVGVWRHICLTYDGSIARVYVDGQLANSGGRAWNLVVVNAFIGKQVNTAAEYWNGSIDDVRIYNRALSDSEITALASAGPATPAPTNVVVTETSSSSLNVKWTDPSINETGFEIQRKTGANGSYATIFTTAANVTSYTDIDLPAKTTYYYQIRTLNTSGNSTYSIAASATTMTAAQHALAHLAFRYQYDNRNRMIAKKVPGADWVYMVYDDRDRLVMAQDGNQRNLNQWSWTKYDQLNRIIMTGIYTHTASLDPEGMRSRISTSVFYETRMNGAVHGYSNDVFSSTNFPGSFEVLTVAYYDDDSYKLITVDPLNDSKFNYVSNEFTSGQYVFAGANTSFPRIRGLVTATKTKVLGESTYYWSVNHYDDKYRVIQNTSHNALGGVDRITNIYDFVGKLMKTKTSHNVGGANAKIVEREFIYDHAGRLMKTWHKLGTTEVLLVQHEYNELGQLMEKKLHSTEPRSTTDASRTYKQKLDYRYNIRGWMSSINDLAATQDATDLFGMNLMYNTKTITGIVEQYNGNIAQINWKGPDGETNQYGYLYDPMNRLKEARYFNTTNATKNARFDEKIIDGSGNPGYDLNGNITFLKRSGITGQNSGITTYGQMDNLEYKYVGNQLMKVIDTSVKTQGFIDDTGNNAQVDYAYDHNGNMITDRNKSITEANTATGKSAITYNYLNLPEKVVKSTGEYIKYVYDAGGRKLRQEVYDASSLLTKKSVYSGEFFYEQVAGQSTPELRFINSEEGRIIPSTTPEHQYHLKDHLGNVRVTFTTKQETETATANYETANATTEYSKFLRTEHVRKVYSSLFDRTNGTSSGYAQRLNGGDNEKFGLARSISVMPGDKFTANVYVKYADKASNDANFNQLLSDIATAITTHNTALVVEGTSFASSTTTFPFATQAGANTGGATNGGPKAYLNWLIFDKDYNFLNGGYRPVPGTAKESGQNISHQLITSGEITVSKPGFVYIFLSNEQPQNDLVEVYFDDFLVEQIKAPVVQVDDYYPFGLTFNSFKRENSVENRIRFQGQEHIDDLGLNWDSFKWRNHQPDIGRFFNVDPLAEKYYYNSPYAFSENRVIDGRELEGLEYAPARGPDGQVDGNATIATLGVPKETYELFNSPSTALSLIAENKGHIAEASEQVGVSPQIIGSIIFQEKTAGLRGDLANLLGGIVNPNGVTRSLGLGEIQIGRAAELRGMDPKNLTSDQISQIKEALQDPKQNIELIALNVKDMEQFVGRELTVQEATYGHNAGKEALKKAIDNGQKTENRVSSRSNSYQDEIAENLR